jgi:hypothetical protein
MMRSQATAVWGAISVDVLARPALASGGLLSALAAWAVLSNWTNAWTALSDALRVVKCA